MTIEKELQCWYDYQNGTEMLTSPSNGTEMLCNNTKGTEMLHWL